MALGWHQLTSTFRILRPQEPGSPTATPAGEGEDCRSQEAAEEDRREPPHLCLLLV